MACQSVAAVMDEQALLGLNPNADARYRQRVRRPLRHTHGSLVHLVKTAKEKSSLYCVVQSRTINSDYSQCRVVVFNMCVCVRVLLQAMAYFEQLKESQDAWEVCAEALAKGIYQ